MKSHNISKFKFLNKLNNKFNLINKIGPFFKNSEKDYCVNIEFAKVIDIQNKEVDYKSVQNIEVNANILECLVLGNIWTKELVYQNFTLKRTTAFFNLNVNESDPNPKALKKILEVNENEILPKELPFSRNSLYSMCLSFSVEKIINEQKIDYVIIPCYELTRYLFLKNSKLEELVFNGPISDYCEKHEDGIIDYENTRLAKIKTKYKYDIIEESIFTDVLYNTELEKSFNSIGANFNQKLMGNPNRKAEISVLMPSTHQHIQACGIDFLFKDKRYFYLYQIYSVDYLPKYDKFYVEPQILNEKGEIIENSDKKSINRTIINCIPNNYNNSSIDDKSKSNSLSITNEFNFEIESPDYFNSNRILPKISHEKFLQKNRYECNSIFITNNTNEFTLNNNRDKNSKIHYANIKVKMLKADLEFETSNFFKAMKNIIDKNENIKLSYYNFSTTKYQNEFHINTVQKIDFIIYKLREENMDICFIDFKNIASIRIVSFYKNNMDYINKENLEEFVLYVIKKERLPSNYEFTKLQIGNNKLSYCIYKKHNLENELVEVQERRILEIFENAKKNIK